MLTSIPFSVLKRRELRLRRESSGLKSLISGLVGGPALLKEWESGWRSKYGGEEADEIQSDSDGDDEDGDDGSDDEDEKPKKKARVVKEKVPKAPKPSPTVSLPVTGADGEVPGKRKRGRPRKIVAPTEPPASIQPLATQDGGKYMLAVFLFFSFFKSPTTTGPLPEYTAPSTTHLGRVLTSSGLYNATSPTTSFALAPAPVAWSEVIHYIHTIASVLVLISLFLPFLSTYFVLPSLFTRSLKFPVKKDMEILGVLGWAKGERNERSKIARALGCEDPSTLDIVREGSRVAMRTFLSFFGYATTSWSSPAETKAWVRIAQIDLATGMFL